MGLWNQVKAITGNASGNMLSAPRFPVATVSTLPSAATVGVGYRSFVTDALLPTFGATVASGGAVKVPVYSDGTSWKVG